MNTVIKTFFAPSSEIELYEILDKFWSEYKKTIKRINRLIVIILYGVVKIFMKEIFIWGIINIIYHPPKSLMF